MLPKLIKTHFPNTFHKSVPYTSGSTMSASMRLKEKLDAVLKNNHAISISNQELKDSNQECKAYNEYLRK